VAPPKPSLAELIPETMKAMRDAFNAHDAKKVASYCSADCLVQCFGAPDAHGRDEVAGAVQHLFDMFGDARSAPVRAWSTGNVVVAEVAWAGTMTGDFMGIKASHKPVGQVRARVLWFNDEGLVTELHEYADDSGLFAQMTGKKNAPPVPVLPTNVPDMHVAGGTPEDDKLAEWAKASDVAFNKNDAKAVAVTMADDADYWLNFSGTTATRGKKALEKSLLTWFKAFPDQKWSTTHAWGVDGFGIVEHAMSGTQKGPLGPIKASNKPVTEWHWIDILQPTAEGTIQHGWGYANLSELMEQTGALRAPGGRDNKSVSTAAGTAPAPKQK
jgi:ketosteroid isomerase-like protein